MLILFLYVLLICLAITAISLTFWLGQIVLERFLLSTLPIIIEIYGRWRYPDVFKES